MTHPTYPISEHRPTLITHEDVLADELQTYKTPEAFAAFMTFLQRAYGRTALAKTLATETRRLAVAHLYEGEGERDAVAKEQASLYAGALLSAYTHTRILHPHKQYMILNQRGDEAINHVEGESERLFRSRLAAYYLELLEYTHQEHEEIYDQDPELAMLMDQTATRISSLPAYGPEYAFSVESGMIYGGLTVDTRAQYYDHFYPNGEKYKPTHYSM